MSLFLCPQVIDRVDGQGPFSAEEEEEGQVMATHAAMVLQHALHADTQVRLIYL